MPSGKWIAVTAGESPIRLPRWPSSGEEHEEDGGTDDEVAARSQLHHGDDERDEGERDADLRAEVVHLDPPVLVVLAFVDEEPGPQCLEQDHDTATTATTV